MHPDLDRAGTAKSPLTRRRYFPGVHGPKGTWAKRSNYGTQLREKQKTKRIYGVLEKQFNNYYKKAIRRAGDTGENMLSMLEKRLDNVVYRLGFAKTRPAARQLVVHGHVLLDGKKAAIPSIQVKIGNTISLKEKLASNAVKAAEIKALDRKAPGWLSRENNQGKVVSEPNLEETKQMIDMRPIIEFYSK